MISRLPAPSKSATTLPGQTRQPDGPMPRCTRAILSIKDEEGVDCRDDLHRPVAVQVSYGGRRVPADLASRRIASAILPLESGSLDGLRRAGGVTNSLLTDATQGEKQFGQDRESESGVRFHHSCPFSMSGRYRRSPLTSTVAVRVMVS